MTFANAMTKDFEAVRGVGAGFNDGQMSFGGGGDGRGRPQFVRRQQQRLERRSASFGVESVDHVIELVDDD